MSNVVGNLRRLTATFRIGTVDADPTTTTLRVKSPNSTVAVYVFGASAIVRDAAGKFHFDLLLANAGTYLIRWEGTGGATAAAELRIEATASRFV